MILSKFISLAYKGLLKPVFFRFDPETVHDHIIGFGSVISKFKPLKLLTRSIFSYQDLVLEQEIFGINFKNPVGLAAGFDKNGQVFDLLGSVGFGFAEVGTVTYKSYEGNPKPRLHRLPDSKGLVVYYGLKNIGAKNVIANLVKKAKEIPQVISIGKTNCKETATFENGLTDYLNCMKEFISAGVGDVYELNISCPNTFGGEPFTDPESLDKLLEAVRSETNPHKPIFLKMPVNLPWVEFKKLVDVAVKYKVDALTIANLNKSREGVKEEIPEHINGNISGKPTEDLSNYLIGETYRYAGDKIKIIGVGGIFNTEDAYKKIRLGASLVELITGMIYEGPQLIGHINSGLAEFLKKDGFRNINEAIGSYHKAYPRV